MGPTASGKTELAIRVAERLQAEIISVDSMQVYRGMDIGTAKPTMLERRGIPHHMIDVVEPDQEFSVAEFRRLGRDLIRESTAPALLITGGSGLHFRALVDPLSFAPTDPRLRSALETEPLPELVADLLRIDPAAGSYVDLANPRRVVRALEIHRLTGETPTLRSESARAEQVRRYVPEIDFVAVGVDPGSALPSRVERRVARMQQGGLVEEVRRLAPRLGRTARRAVGYRQVLEALKGKTSIPEALQRVAADTKRLARKQRTWFQRDPRIRWIPWLEDEGSRLERVLEVLE